jgi:hypothetical protein
MLRDFTIGRGGGGGRADGCRGARWRMGRATASVCAAAGQGIG